MREMIKETDYAPGKRVWLRLLIEMTLAAIVLILMEGNHASNPAQAERQTALAVSRPAAARIYGPSTGRTSLAGQPANEKSPAAADGNNRR